MTHILEETGLTTVVCENSKWNHNFTFLSFHLFIIKIFIIKIFDHQTFTALNLYAI